MRPEYGGRGRRRSCRALDRLVLVRPRLADGLADLSEPAAVTGLAALTLSVSSRALSAAFLVAAVALLMGWKATGLLRPSPSTTLR